MCRVHSQVTQSLRYSFMVTYFLTKLREMVYDVALAWTRFILPWRDVRDIEYSIAKFVSDTNRILGGFLRVEE